MKWEEWAIILLIILAIGYFNNSANAGIKDYADAKTSNDYTTAVESIDKNHVIIVRNWK